MAAAGMHPRLCRWRQAPLVPPVAGVRVVWGGGYLGRGPPTHTGGKVARGGPAAEPAALTLGAGEAWKCAARVQVGVLSWTMGRGQLCPERPVPQPLPCDVAPAPGAFCSFLHQILPRVAAPMGPACDRGLAVCVWPTQPRSTVRCQASPRSEAPCVRCASPGASQWPDGTPRPAPMLSRPLTCWEGPCHGG